MVLGGPFSLMDVADTLCKVTDGLQYTYKVTYMASVPAEKQVSISPFYYVE